MKKRIRFYIISACLIALILLFFRYENHHLVVTEYIYQSDKVKDDLKGYRIVQISDLHNAEFGYDNEKLINKINELKPDMIVVTGDIVDSNHTDIDIAISFVNQAAKIYPVYYVTGNHEYWLSKDDQTRLIHGIVQAGGIILDNENVDISVGNSNFCLIGLDENSLTSNTLKNMMEKIENSNLSVVLAHEPQYLSQYALTGCDLVLAGHAHGGQFVLPFLGAVVAPDQGFFPQYTSGKHQEKQTTMYISRGLGNSIIPVRLFNAPEIVCIELESNKQASENINSQK